MAVKQASANIPFSGANMSLATWKHYSKDFLGLPKFLGLL